MGIELFPDQQEALDAVLSVYQKQPQGGMALVVAATGWGKTVFFSFLARKLREAGNVLVIAHREELLHQAIDKFCMIDPDAHIGKVGGGSHQYGAPITVAGIDTISGEKHLKNLHKFGYKLVIWDECHHCQSPKYYKVREALADAFHLGVTATPSRLDKRSLTPLFGKPVFTMTIPDAIRAGRLCDLRAIAPKTEVDLSTIGSRKNSDGETDFNPTELEHAIDIEPRNRRAVEAYQQYASGRRAICFAVSVQHARHLADAFNRAGIPAAAISGDMAPYQRQPLYAKLQTGEIKILSSVQVLSEGFDCPLVSCVIMARPTQSQALYTQAIGRGLRLAPGKKDCLVLDLTDNSERLRLIPQSLGRALEIPRLTSNRSVKDAIEHAEEEEAQEKRAIVRKVSDNRQADLEIDLFALPQWQERPDGKFVLEVGVQKHRIALIPCKGEHAGKYDVWARLAPTFVAQKWMSGQALDWALQFAEKCARQLLSEPSSIKLMDKEAGWRGQPISENQIKFMKWRRIPWTVTMTKGEASEAIDAYKQKKEAEAAAKEARKAARQEQEEEVRGHLNYRNEGFRLLR